MRRIRRRPVEFSRSRGVAKRGRERARQRLKRRREHDRTMRILCHVLRVEEEVNLVLNQRPAQLAAQIRPLKLQVLSAGSLRKRNAPVPEQTECFAVKTRTSRSRLHAHFPRRPRPNRHIQHRAVDVHLSLVADLKKNLAALPVATDCGGPRRRSISSADAELLARLTAREVEVLELIGEGKRTKEIGHLLGVSFKTAVTHRSHVMDKLGIHEGPNLVRFAVRAGLCKLQYSRLV